MVQLGKYLFRVMRLYWRKIEQSVEKVAEITGAGTDCGRCKVLVKNIIDLGR